MRLRIAADLARLLEAYGEVEHLEANGEDWFKIPSFPLPKGWLVDGVRRAHVPVAFPVKADYPGASPYGFLTPSGLSFDGAAPDNTGAATSSVPFAGDWMFFSWHCEDWPACSESGAGPDLVSWSRSFANRLSEGA